MTRDVAAQAVHERLESLAATMPEPDIEAGWAALVAQLEPPVAPVVPLRPRPRPRRAIVLGVAAAIVIGGSALAMVRHGGNDGQHGVQPSAVAPGGAILGPHNHPPFSGPQRADHGSSPGYADGHHHGSTGQAAGSTPSNGGSGDSTSGSDGNGGTHSFHHDSPNDTDHGTGNDVHGDNGQGNNTQGQDTQGDGSSGGSGSDQGSGGGQGSGNRATHATGGGEHASGSDSGHGSGWQGQGGGRGQGSHG
jgi:hypothetical protein